jgi:hypothetical protein
MTALRYNAANSNEVNTIRTNTATGSDTAIEKRGIILMTPMDAQAATREARKYFHTAESTGAMPKCMGGQLAWLVLNRFGITVIRFS